MKKVFLSNFWLKVIACIAMTIAHISNFMYFFGMIKYDSNAFFIMQLIGKISFPIFAFLIIEGINHTHNVKKYLGRLLGCSVICYFVLLVMNLPVFTQKLGVGGLDKFGNIFLDLFLIGLIYYLLQSENKKHKFYAIIPVLYIVAMTIIKYLKVATIIPFDYYHCLYDGLYTQYDIITLLLIFGYTIAYKINDYQVKKVIKDPELIEVFKASDDYQFRKNICAFVAVLTISVICYLISLIPDPNMVYYCDFAITSYVALGGIILLFYNGKLGFHNKLIQGAFYLYYPLHLAIIFLIFYLL